MLDCQLISGIYQIYNLLNGKIYIGSTNNFNKRWAEHRRTLLNNSHHNAKLQAAYNKYGIHNFTYSVVEYCDVDLLTVVEQKYLDALDIEVNYNICPTAYSTLGFKHSESTIAKMCNKSLSTRQKLREAQLGRKYSDEVKLKVSAAGKGKLRSEATKQKMRKPKSELHRANIAKAQLGRVATPERIENQRQVALLSHRKRKLMTKLTALNSLLLELMAFFESNRQVQATYA